MDRRRKAAKKQRRYLPGLKEGVDHCSLSHHFGDLITGQTRVDFGRLDLESSFIHDALNPLIEIDASNRLVFFSMAGACSTVMDVIS
jgi:hypothetical protein